MELSTSVFVPLLFMLIAFQLKHFIADFPLQNAYMLGKFKKKGWVLPLASHCGVHALLTGFILILTGLIPIWLVLSMMAFDFTIHFIMDRIKASPSMLGRYDIKDKRFWWSLGLDQMVHHITHYIILFITMTYVLRSLQ